MAFSFTSKEWDRLNIEINDLRQSPLPPPAASIGSHIRRIREHDERASRINGRLHSVYFAAPELDRSLVTSIAPHGVSRVRKNHLIIRRLSNGNKSVWSMKGAHSLL